MGHFVSTRCKWGEDPIFQTLACTHWDPKQVLQALFELWCPMWATKIFSKDVTIGQIRTENRSQGSQHRIVKKAVLNPLRCSNKCLFPIESRSPLLALQPAH